MPIPSSDPIVTVPVATPLDENDAVDLEALAHNVQLWMKTPAAGFIVGSATGEEWYLSEQEKLDIARTIKQELDDERFLIGGIDCPGVTETLRRIDDFAEAGAEVARVRFPRYESTVESYFTQVLNRSALPVLLMHQCNPERFGLTGQSAAAPEVLASICNMDNVFGYVTDHDPRFEAQVRRLVTEDRRFWICNGSLILFGTLIGCNGTTTAFANIWPESLHDLLVKGMANNYEEAWPLQDQVQRIDALMLKYHSTGVKAAMNLLGFKGMRPRQPTKPVPPEDVAKLEQLLRDAGRLQ